MVASAGVDKEAIVHGVLDSVALEGIEMTGGDGYAGGYNTEQPLRAAPATVYGRPRKTQWAIIGQTREL